MPNIGWPELMIIAAVFAVIVSMIGVRAGGRRWVWAFLGFFFSFLALFSVICYWMAATKGRSKDLWAVLGFFFPLIALIVLAVLPPETSAPAATGT